MVATRASVCLLSISSILGTRLIDAITIMKVEKLVGRQSTLTFCDGEVLRPSFERSSEVVSSTELRLFVGRRRGVVVVLDS